MSQKNTYRELCALESGIPIFSQDWWLDAVSGPENWDVAVIEKGGRVVATMPYHIDRGFGLTRLVMPKLTQTLGPWIRARDVSHSRVLSVEKDLMNELVEQLPAYHEFSQNWHHSRTNWLPFYWRGFTQSTRYTYILEDLTDPDVLWKGLQQNIRGDIRKAQGRYGLELVEDLDLDDFMELNEKVFSRQGIRLPYSRDLVNRIDAACAARDCRRIIVARDAQGRAHAGVYIVWDANSAYYLMGGGDSKLRNSGATSLCMWRAIQHAATVTKAFDFEGSMIEPVERFFRAFGAKQTPYFRIRKTPSIILKFLHFAAGLKNG